MAVKRVPYVGLCIIDAGYGEFTGKSVIIWHTSAEDFSKQSGKYLELIRLCSFGVIISSVFSGFAFGAA